MTVEEQLKAGLCASDDDSLIRSRAREDDVFGKELIFGHRGERVGLYHRDHQKRDDQDTSNAQSGDPTVDQRAHEPRSPQSDSRVQQTKKQRRSDEPELWHKEEGKQKRG